MKYIIDTDPGIDDAIAIMLGYLNKLDIIGFTLATGNVAKKKSINNLKIIQNVLGSNIKMYIGSKENVSNVSAEYAHGVDGLGNIFMPESTRKIEDTYAEDFIIRSVYKYKNNLTIICLGPLTNLASAISKDNNIVDKISKVIIMGASYDNLTEIPYNEFNFKIDFESTKLILNSSLKDIRIITHEVGIKSYIKKSYMNSLVNSTNKISKFVYLISQKYMEFCYENYKIIGCCMPDPVTVASVIDENIIDYIPCNVNIKNDLIYLIKTKESNISVSFKIDIDKFTNLFEHTFN